MTAMEQPKRLGRGLEALLGPVNKEQAAASGALREIPLAQISPNPYQPRTRFDDAALAELTESIRASGLLQPIVVRAAGPGKYQIIAGERRWRAVTALGLATVPAVVKTADDKTLLTLAMIENVQRHDLSSIDEALGYKRMQDEFGVGVSEIARLTGKNRSTVANLIRLLGLPPELQELVHEGRLTEGHARALLAFADVHEMRRVARETIDGGWSVRMVEAAARGEESSIAERDVADETPKPSAPPRHAVPSPLKVKTADVRRVEESLRRRLGTDVKVSTRRGGRGYVTLAFYSNDDLARLLELMLGESFGG